MSQVAISGNASGTGTLTIAAPNTNSNYTLTLPENTGTLISTKSAGTVLQVVQTVKTDTFTTTVGTQLRSVITQRILVKKGKAMNDPICLDIFKEIE